VIDAGRLSLRRRLISSSSQCGRTKSNYSQPGAQYKEFEKRLGGRH
jgi:hypothetical protein